LIAVGLKKKIVGRPGSIGNDLPAVFHPETYGQQKTDIDFFPEKKIVDQIKILVFQVKGIEVKVFRIVQAVY
jgi:hypothetical protein